MAAPPLLPHGEVCSFRPLCDSLEGTAVLLLVTTVTGESQVLLRYPVSTTAAISITQHKGLAAAFLLGPRRVQDSASESLFLSLWTSVWLRIDSEALSGSSGFVHCCPQFWAVRGEAGTSGCTVLVTSVSYIHISKHNAALIKFFMCSATLREAGNWKYGILSPRSCFCSSPCLLRMLVLQFLAVISVFTVP